MKNKYFHQPKVMSWVLSSVLLFGGCQFRSDSKNKANDFLSTHNQIESKWEELGSDILAKAVGNSDQKVFIDPTLLAAIVEAEPIQDKTIIKNTLYQKTQTLRKAIENPANQNNLLSILSQYYLEVHEPQNIKVLSYWSVNKKYMPNVFVYQRDHLPYEDKTLTSKEKELGITAMAYLPQNSREYYFVNKTLVNYKNYLAKQNDFKGYDWVKNKMIHSVLRSQRAAFSMQSALALKGPLNSPKGVYADLYQKLVLLGVISQYEKPSTALLMKAVMNSHFFVKEPTAVKQALQSGDLSLILSENSAKQLILYCDETMQQWRETRDFFEQLKKLFPDDKKELIKNIPLDTESNRDALVKIFIDEFNREAKTISIPSFYAHIGLPENYPMNDLFYEKLKKVVDRYEQLSGPYGAPLKGQITSGFGWRRDPLLEEIKHHGGIDIAGFLGTPLRAVMAGTAHVHYGDDDFGNFVIIKNDRTGEEVIYAHCQKILVSEGAKISNGDIVALLGATGRVTGPHLHIERHLKGQPVPFINMNRKDLMVLNSLQDFVLFLAQVCLVK